MEAKQMLLDYIKQRWGVPLTSDDPLLEKIWHAWKNEIIEEAIKRMEERRQNHD